MRLLLSLVILLPVVYSAKADIIADTLPSDPTDDPIPFATRERWMRRAITALYELNSPCPFEGFGAAIVNHTSLTEGELVCIGVNSLRVDGDPTLHGI